MNPEVDHDAGASDHLGDRVELADPYPASRAAWRGAQQLLPGDVHADPDEVRRDMAMFAAAPHRQGTQTREVTPTGWHPAGWILGSGPQGFLLVDEDPYRVRTTVYNHSTGPVYLAPTPTRSPGIGALYLPAYDPAVGIVHSRVITSTGRVYLFTTSGFAPGTEPVHVQVLTERWG